ncbi:MAG: hypothetical protein Q8P12_02280 [bacterium]|nr:hypothetical protein [bacterium]
MKVMPNPNRESFESVARRGCAAFDAVIREATNEGLWDLHVALEKGAFNSADGRTRLIQGGWGSLVMGKQPAAPRVVLFPSADVLTALFHTEDCRLGRALMGPALLSEIAMRKHGFRARDFYIPWDAGLLDPKVLLERLDQLITNRIGGPA